MIIALIVLAVLAFLVGFTLLILRMQPRTEPGRLDWLNQTGAALGLEGEARSDRAAAVDCVDGQVQGVTVRLGMRRYESVQQPRSRFREVTILQLHFARPLELGLLIAPGSKRNRRNLSGHGDNVTTGIADFDGALVAVARESGPAQQLMLSMVDELTIAERIAAASAWGDFTLADQSFSLELDRFKPDPAELQPALDQLLALYRALEQAR